MDYPKIDKLNASNCTERSIEKHYHEFWKYIIDNYHCVNWTERLYWFYHDLKDYPKCPVCGKATKFVNLKTGYREFCSTKCMNSSKSVQDRKKQTSLKNWGTESPMQSKQVREKLKNAVREKYGVDNVFQSPDFKEKRIKTNLEKYGTEHHLQNPNIMDKQIQTNIERYGVAHISQLESYKKIIKNTCNAKYGGVGNQSEILLNKYKTTVRSNNIKKYDFLIGYDENGDWICKCPHPDCDKCKDKFYITTDLIQYSRSRLQVETCTRLFPVDNSRCKNTSIELFIQKLLESHNIEYQSNIRSIIPPKELDIYIPSKNIAIECNGIYSHSTKYKYPKYHINKSELCKEKGIRLIHIWEDWVKNKPEIVESILLSKLGLIGNTIYARKCIIKEVDSKTCNDFLEANHIQGKSASKIKLGLYYNDQLVSVMTFSPPRINMGSKNHKCQWELVRFCNKINLRVIGGASKLLKYFIKNYNPESIVSFSMNDISTGELYDYLGFINNGKINQSYWYIESNTLKRYHRSSFSKHEIVRRGWRDKVDNTWTEREVVEEHGYFCIYDSGQLRWVLNLE